jgi:hypothetical protein
MLFVLISATALAQGTPCAPTEKPFTGSVVEGGYAFEYESIRGVDCRIYRLRNTPGKPLTPVVWRDGSDVLLDVTLPACRAGHACTPQEVKKDGIAVTTTPTKISFGFNKDEYSEPTTAYGRLKLATANPALPDRTLSFTGSVANAKGANTPVAVALTSYVDKSADGYALNYKLSASTDPHSVVPDDLFIAFEIEGRTRRVRYRDLVRKDIEIKKTSKSIRGDVALNLRIVSDDRIVAATHSFTY